MSFSASLGVPVVVLGDVMLDVLTVVSDEPTHGSDTASQVSLRPGGSAANVAAWLAFEGTKTAYVGRVGNDQTGRQAIAALHDIGVHTWISIDSVLPTGVCVVLVSSDGERTMFPEVGANAALSTSDVDAALAEVRDAVWHLHVSGYALLSGAREAAVHALVYARRHGSSTSVTCASAAPLQRVGAARFLELTRNAELLFANAEEAQLLSGRPDAVDAAAALSHSYSAVVVTCGVAGAVFAVSGQVPVHSPASPVHVVDSTGAGDAFAAGFLTAWLSGSEPALALEAGHRRAAEAIQQLGGRPRGGTGTSTAARDPTTSPA